MSTDVLTQARTPRKGTMEAVADALAPQLPGEIAENVLSAAESAESVVLEREAPRILALAYREAARHFRGFIIRSGDTFDAAEVVKQLEALATALEEGTPE